jgi:hypothetical protein
MTVTTTTDTRDGGDLPASSGQRAPRRVQGGLLDPRLLWTSLPGALAKLNPATLYKNPVMFLVEIGAVFTTVLAIAHPSTFAWLIVIWLWLTSLFANLAEAVAEGRGKAQADALRRAKTDTMARRLVDADNWSGREESVPAPELQRGDRVVCEAGDVIPGDGDVIEGIASVDESAITGESAPVIRESGGDRSSVTGGTRVLSDRIVVEITQQPGQSFIDRMIALVEGASRHKTPNEIALNILLASLTIIFLLATVTLQPLAIFSKVNQHHRHRHRLAAGVPDPDHDRGAAVGHRYRRHGPAGAAQRAGHERARRRGRRRREHIAAGQDGNDHTRQPAGQRIHPRRSADRGTRGRRTTLLARRRDTGGSLGRRAGQDGIRPAGAVGRRPDARRMGAVHGPDPDERRRPVSYRQRTAA